MPHSVTENKVTLWVIWFSGAILLVSLLSIALAYLTIFWNGVNILESLFRL